MATALREPSPQAGTPSRHAYAQLLVYQARRNRSMFMRNAKRGQPYAVHEVPRSSRSV